MSSTEFPAGMLAVSAIPRRLLEWGVPMGPMHLLETVGRRSGNTHVVPIVLLRTGGSGWLVSPFGEVAWVRNHRAGSPVRLGRGKNLRPVDLEDAPAAEVPALLRLYRKRFGMIPFVRAAFAAGAKDHLGAFEAEAAGHPVFRVVFSNTRTATPTTTSVDKTSGPTPS